MDAGREINRTIDGAGHGPEAPASWERRVWATWFDLIVVGSPALAPIIYALATAERTGVSATGSAELTPVGLGLVAAWLGVLLYLVLWGWNRYAVQARAGASLGKRRQRIRVVLVADGTAPSAARLLARDAAHVLDVLPACLGLLWPLWDRRRQTFADKITGTGVVERSGGVVGDHEHDVPRELDDVGQ